MNNYIVYLLFGSNKEQILQEKRLTPTQIVCSATFDIAKELVNEEFVAELKPSDFKEEKGGGIWNFVSKRYELYLSSLLQTSPVGEFIEKKVEDFVNRIVAIRTTKEPFEVLNIIQQAESKYGRDRDCSALKKGENKRIKKRYSSRTLDIDILQIFKEENNQKREVFVDTPRLQIPHPQIESREFVKILLEDLKDFE